MSKNTPKPSAIQLDMFDSPKKRPPLRAADDYGFDLQHYVMENGDHLYSVQDWIMGVAKTADTQQAKNIFQKFKKRRTSDNLALVVLPYLSPNGRTYQMEFASEKTLYTLTQYIQANTGIRNAVLDFLASAGVAVGDAEQIVAKTADTQPLAAKDKRLISAKIDQGYSDDEAKTFLQLVKEGVPTRKELTAVFKLVVRGTINYAQITDTEYKAIFDMTAKEIRAMTGFKTARDGMTPTGRAIVTAAETALESVFMQQRDLTFDRAMQLTYEVCSAYGGTVKKLETVMGVSLATGHKLLN